MGDRISISFKNGDDESVIFYSHYLGLALKQVVETYLNQLNHDVPKSDESPLSRREPNTVIVDFVRYVVVDDERVLHDFQLLTNPNNFDNGHFIWDLENAKWM